MLIIAVPIIVGYIFGWISCYWDKKWGFKQFAFGFFIFGFIAFAIVGVFSLLFTGTYQTNYEVVEVNEYNILTITDNGNNKYTLKCEDIETKEISNITAYNPIINRSDENKDYTLNIHEMEYKNKVLEFFIPFGQEEYRIYVPSNDILFK